jgi:hypothetical protein
VRLSQRGGLSRQAAAQGDNFPQFFEFFILGARARRDSLDLGVLDPLNYGLPDFSLVLNAGFGDERRSEEALFGDIQQGLEFFVTARFRCVRVCAGKQRINSAGDDSCPLLFVHP